MCFCRIHGQLYNILEDGKNQCVIMEHIKPANVRKRTAAEAAAARKPYSGVRFTEQRYKTTRQEL